MATEEPRTHVGTWGVDDFDVSEDRVGDWKVVLVTPTNSTSILGVAVVPIPAVEEYDAFESFGDDQPSALGWQLHHAAGVGLAGRTERPSLSAVDLRKLPFRQMLAAREATVIRPFNDAALATVRSWPRVLWEDDLAAEFGLTADDISAIDYLRDAYLFAQAVQAGDARPVVRVSRQLQHASRQTTAGRLTTARRRHKLLTEPRPGQVAGELTEKATRLVGVMNALAATRPRTDGEKDNA